MTWSPSNPPIRGGSFSRFVIKRAQTLPKGLRGVVALPFTHDWGPVKTFVSLTDLADFNSVYGQGGDPANYVYTPGYIAVYNAFKGAGPDEPGAAAVVAYRTGSSSIAKAAVTLSNTTPATSIRIRGVYEGTRGNTLKVAIQANAANPSTAHDLLVYLGNTQVEMWTFLKTDQNALATMVNKTVGGSNWIRIDGPGGGAIVSGVALAIVAATALTGGLDGETLIAQDWTDLRTAYESQAFEVFVPYDLTDPTITTALHQWVALKNEPATPTRAKRFHAVTGGLAGETIATAITRAGTANWQDVTTLGVGTYKDDALNINLSTSQLAPRLAGVIARHGFSTSIFCTHLADLEIVSGPSDSDILSGIQNGVVTMALDSVGVRFESAITTYTSDTADKPKWAFGVIKYAFTMESFERALQLQHESGGMIGRLNVNEDARETLIGNGQALLDDVYVAQGGVQSGAQVVISQDPPPSDDQTFIGLDWIAKFERSLEQVRNTFYLS